MAKSKQKGVQLVQAYHNVFNTREGTIVLNDLMATCHFLSPTYRDDINDMVFCEGQRNVVLKILKYLNTSPEQIKERIAEYEKTLAETNVV